jgi:hypothetical protein
MALDEVLNPPYKHNIIDQMFVDRHIDERIVVSAS